jgi:hypothetical protein
MDPFEFEDDNHRPFDDFDDGDELGNELDFGSTLRRDDAFWREDEDDDDDVYPEITSAPVIEDFADFSAFDSSTNDNSEARNDANIEFDLVKFDDEL